MTMNDSILTQENNQKRAKVSAQPDKAAQPLQGKSEEMVSLPPLDVGTGSPHRASHFLAR